MRPFNAVVYNVNSKQIWTHRVPDFDRQCAGISDLTSVLMCPSSSDTGNGFHSGPCPIVWL